MIYDDLHNKCSDTNAKTLVAYSDLKNRIHSFDQTLIILIACYNELALILLHLMNDIQAFIWDRTCKFCVRECICVSGSLRFMGAVRVLRC